MKQLEGIAFDYLLCRQQVEEFRSWLAGKEELAEQRDVLPFFRDRLQMAVLFGMLNPRIAWADRIAWEFDLFGDLACDLAVGEWARAAYCFIEFEDARPDSVFQKQGTKATREWGPRFDHGFSQIIDWAPKLDSRSPGTDLARKVRSPRDQLRGGPRDRQGPAPGCRLRGRWAREGFCLRPAGHPPLCAQDKRKPKRKSSARQSATQAPRRAGPAPTQPAAMPNPSRPEQHARVPV